MKIVKMIARSLVVMTLFSVPLNSEAAPGCHPQDEELWLKHQKALPTSDFNNIKIVIYDLTKLKDRCDPKTRFSASVVQLLIKANFRQAELDEALRNTVTSGDKLKSVYDPVGMPGRW